MFTSVERPDPDALLQQVEAGEAENGRGRLKVFLGYASGVGKSLKMLDEGRRRRERGQDIVVGAMQTPASEEVAHTLEKLEVIPLRVVNGMHAMDMERILARRPAICLVDGLAYDNPPGSRHDRRWQDVQELLDSGISVISSINIQFIEDVQERVEAITRKHVNESVPQKFISAADEIVVVDAPPETCAVRSSESGLDIKLLQQRLSELRELALLLAADVVDRQLETYLRRNGIASSLGAQERILVCLTPGFDATGMVASGRRNAERFHCDFHAVYVREKRLSAEEEARLNRNMELARGAGASVCVLGEDDAIDAILEYARSKGITQVFVGHSPRRKWWERLSGSSLDRLIRGADGLDVKVFPH
jgi:two-component system, OmpR family, sensor histidine kinase KdpD